MKETGMKKIQSRAMALLLVLFITGMSCKKANDKPELPTKTSTEKKESLPDPQEEEIKC